MPIYRSEDMTSSVNFVDSFPEGEAEDKAKIKPSHWGEAEDKENTPKREEPQTAERAQKGMVICKDFLFGSKLFSVICSREYCRYSRAYFSA